jgi:rhodanese-related sulfurtransferase
MSVLLSGQRFLGSLCVGAALMLVSQHAAAQAVPLEQARTELEAGRVVLIDVRETAEQAAGVVPGARLLPMSQITGHAAEVLADKNAPLLLICQTQNRSKNLAQTLKEQGYTQVRYVTGGMREWTQRGLPMVKP